jgi:hypothetical protein
MKKILFASVILFSFAACNNNGPKEDNTKSTDTTQANTSANNVTEKKPLSSNEVVAAYLQLKNALVNDNGKEAATAAKEIIAAWQKIDQASLTTEQKKIYDDVNEDIQEHAEHISKNGDKIEHQREHFDLLSDIMYELVKGIAPGRTLYKDRCLMYNDNKGAIWLSEVREIKNPYYGKKMLTCGVIKEEIK